MTSRTAACNSAEGSLTSAKQRQSRGMKTDGQREKWWQEEHRIRKLWHHQRTCVYWGHYQSLNEWCQTQKAELQLSSSETAPSSRLVQLHIWDAPIPSGDNCGRTTDKYITLIQHMTYMYIVWWLNSVKISWNKPLINFITYMYIRILQVIIHRLSLLQLILTEFNQCGVNTCMPKLLTEPYTIDLHSPVAMDVSHSL